MFTSIRFSFKMKNGCRVITMTVKSWPSEKKAKDYLKRYASIPWFAGGVVEEDGAVLYELTPTGSEHFYEPIERMLRKMAERPEPKIPFDEDFIYSAFSESTASLSLCPS